MCIRDRVSTQSTWEFNMTSISTNQAMLFSKIAGALENFEDFYSSSETPKASCQSTFRTKSRFTSSALPKISISDYLQQILTVGRIPEEAIIMALIYIRKFWKLGKYRVSALEAHRLLAASCAIAVKFLCDEHYYNSFYARVFRLKLREFNKLESGLLKELKYKVFVTTEEYEKVYVALKEDRKNSI
eukprot:TRINITY_DN5663_c0_g1_i12.p1 TRINITY_DN5663_c0_g1~~TRINITY_DN5663_c0_g1_i12.p1  ORF type:complete len:187 (+),score=23.66 TRINITY_DN5663_c0_g1_i12:2-562(+)